MGVCLVWSALHGQAAGCWRESLGRVGPLLITAGSRAASRPASSALRTTTLSGLPPATQVQVPASGTVGSTTNYRNSSASPSYRKSRANVRFRHSVWPGRGTQVQGTRFRYFAWPTTGNTMDSWMLNVWLFVVDVIVGSWLLHCSVGKCGCGGGVGCSSVVDW